MAKKNKQTPTRSRAQVVKACIAAGAPADLELNQGNGYLYFWSADIAGWSSSSVPVCRLRHIETVEGWVQTYLSMAAENGEVRS
jgi:hypothetical protein